MRKAMESAAVIHVTEPEEGRAVRALGITTPLALVPNGVELPDTRLVESWLAQRAARGERPRRFLFLSRVHKKKGIDLLLRAWSKSVARKIGCRLIVAGPCESEDYGKYLGQMVARLSLSDSVEFVGMIRGADRERLFREADIFVLPSHSENFGVAIAEALARGLPVITTTGTPWRIIAMDAAGWWIDLSEHDLLRVLDEAAGLPSAALLSMGAKAAAIARKFGWDVQAERMAEVYAWLFGGAIPSTVLVDNDWGIGHS